MTGWFWFFIILLLKHLLSQILLSKFWFPFYHPLLLHLCFFENKVQSVFIFTGKCCVCLACIISSLLFYLLLSLVLDELLITRSWLISLLQGTPGRSFANPTLLCMCFSCVCWSKLLRCTRVLLLVVFHCYQLSKVLSVTEHQAIVLTVLICGSQISRLAGFSYWSASNVHLGS